MSARPDHQRTRLGRRAAPPGGRRAAALDRGRAVGPRRDAALRSHALRVRHRGGPEGRGLLPRAPPRGLRVDARALHGGRADRRRSPSPSTCARAASSTRPAAQARDRRAHRRPSPRSATCASTRRSSASTRCCAACSRASYEIQASVHGHEAPPRELVERAERADPRGRPRRPPEGLPPRRRGPARRGRKWQELSAEGTLAHRHAVRLRRPRRDHRRLPARQPDHHRGKTVDGEVRCGLGAGLRPDDRCAPAHRRGRRADRGWRGGLRRARRPRPQAACRRARPPRSATASQPVFRAHDAPGAAHRGDREPPAADDRRLAARSTSSQPGDRDRGAAPPAAPGVPSRRCPTTSSCCSPRSSPTAASTERTPRFCFGPDSPDARRGAEAAAAFGRCGCSTSQRGHGDAPRSAPDAAPRANPVTRAVRAPRPLGASAPPTSSSPTRSSASTTSGIARFLGGPLRAATATSTPASGCSQIGYTTISERLARDVQHLLLRLGIVSRIRTLQAATVYEGTDKVAREVLITGQDGLATRSASWVRVVRQGGAAGARSLDAARVGPRGPTSTRSRPTSGSAVLAAKGERLLGRRQRGHGPSAQPQLARRHARPLAAAHRRARRRRPTTTALAAARRPRTCGGTRSRRSSRSAKQETFDIDGARATTTSSPTTSSSTTARWSPTWPRTSR